MSNLYRFSFDLKSFPHSFSSQYINFGYTFINILFIYFIKLFPGKKFFLQFNNDFLLF